MPYLYMNRRSSSILREIHHPWRGLLLTSKLWRELRARGYAGAASNVRPYLALLRQVPDTLRPSASVRQKKVVPEKGLSTHRFIRLGLAQPEHLTAEQRQEREQVFSLHPEIAVALTQAQAFVKMLQEHNAEALSGWL